VTLFFRKAIFLYLCIISFSLFSGNGFAGPAYEKCQNEWIPFHVGLCETEHAKCVAWLGAQECDGPPCSSQFKCRYIEDTACEYAQGLTLLTHLGVYYIDPDRGGWYVGDENCVEPNPDETPPDPLADQLNDVSLPNECRGE
jgi:hypothetical protein